jgi:hypothetical protein
MRSIHQDAAEILARAVTVARIMDKKGQRPLRGVRTCFDISPSQEKRRNAHLHVMKQIERKPSDFIGCIWGLCWALSGCDPKVGLTETGRRLGFSASGIGAMLWLNDSARASWGELAGYLQRFRRMSDAEILDECLAVAKRKGLAWEDARFLKWLDGAPTTAEAELVDQLKADGATKIASRAALDALAEKLAHMPAAVAPSSTAAVVEKLKADALKSGLKSEQQPVEVA